jgi:hypothetical protein
MDVLVGTEARVGVRVGDGEEKVKLARARLLWVRHVALTEMVTIWPADPVTVNDPERLPELSMSADPVTPAPETTTPPLAGG